MVEAQSHLKNSFLENHSECGNRHLSKLLDPELSRLENDNLKFSKPTFSGTFRALDNLMIINV